ncbi:MAG: trigger factor [Pseudomonadota bacterium]
MQVTEQLNDGLKREIAISIPKEDLETRLSERLEEMKGRAQIKGFRPGKVPMSHLRKMYGKAAMSEIVNELITATPENVLRDRSEKSATRPDIDMTEDEAEAGEILDGKRDFDFVIKYEVMPDFEVAAYDGIKITRPVVDIEEDEVNAQVERIAESAREYSEKKGKAAKGDRVTLDFLGKVDGEAFDGGAAEDHKLVLGSGTFIPGFEDQLVGMKADETGVVKVTFPEDYQAENLAGKDAEFDVTIKMVEKPGDLEINDELAEKLGLESADRLREIVRDQLTNQYGGMTRQKVKRQLLDELDKTYSFELPEKLVEQEFGNIWTQVTRDLESADKTFEDEDTTEEEARTEYRALAERRVRLGLVMSRIGESEEIEVSEEEMQRALYAQMQQYPGQEKAIMEFYQQNPEAVATLRAPIFEDKVVDHILEKADVTDETVTKEELMKDDEDE